MNTSLLTVAAFLAYVITAALLLPSPILIAPLSEQYGLSSADVARLLGRFNIGILAGAVIAVRLLLAISLRQALLGTSLLLAAVLALLAAFPLKGVIGVALFVAGMCCGIALPAAANVISAVHTADRRASMLVVTDGAFSLSGFAVVAVGGAILAAGHAWFWVYAQAFAAAIALAVLSMVGNFSQLETPPEPLRLAGWPAGIWWCSLALLCFTLGQFTMVLWLPTYLEVAHDVARAASGTPVARYFVALFAGQLLAALVVLKIGLRRLLPVAAVLAAAVALALGYADSLQTAATLAIVWGVATLGLLKLVVSLGTQFAVSSQAAVISVLLLAATIGTAVAPALSSQVVELASERAALWLSFGALVLCAAAVAMALRSSTAGHDGR